MVFSKHLKEILSVLGRSGNALADGSKQREATLPFLFELAFEFEYCGRTAGEQVTLLTGWCECDHRFKIVLMMS